MRPELIRTVPDIRRRVVEGKRANRTVGFVPTMGALHLGHGALIERARLESDVVIVSIFVNPIQFDRNEDYERYTRTLSEDLEFCGLRAVDAVFAPDAKEMYPTALRSFVEVTELSAGLCGQFRPGHFRGVTTVVTKLLNIVQPDRAYFGEKDAQQLAIIQKMVADLNIPVAIISVPTVREQDGLALSSRNQRLSPEERRAAPVLYRALQEARARIESGCDEPWQVKAAAFAILKEELRVRPEYLEVVDPADMRPVERISGPVRVAAAVWLGPTRLIDNVLCSPCLKD